MCKIVSSLKPESSLKPPPYMQPYYAVVIDCKLKGIRGRHSDGHILLAAYSAYGRTERLVSPPKSTREVLLNTQQQNMSCSNHNLRDQPIAAIEVSCGSSQKPTRSWLVIRFAHVICLLTQVRAAFPVQA